LFYFQISVICAFDRIVHVHNQPGGRGVCQEDGVQISDVRVKRGAGIQRPAVPGDARGEEQA
jgi:hypothetical protein